MSIFGGNTGVTYEQLQKRRKMAEQLRSKNARTPQNVGEGIHAIARALVARGIDKQNTKRSAEMKADFDERFSQVAPNQQGLVDLATSPYATGAHREVISALMDGAPNYRRGTAFHPGGQAVVGENGPEVVELPYGASVDPIRPSQRRQQIPQQQPQQVMDPALQNQLQQYDPASRQRMQDTGDMPMSPEFEGRELMGPQSRAPESVFDDEKAFRTAELDAFKMMGLKPEYGDPAKADINTTEGGRLSLLRRMMFADAALEDPRLAKAMTRIDENIAGKLGALGRLYTSDEYELGNLMSEQFANAVLRNDSGAQAPDSEVRKYTQQYFPLPNDSPSQLRAKAALRREVIRSMVQALGGDAAPAAKQVVEEINSLRDQADVPDGTLSNGAQQTRSQAKPSAPDGDGWQTINGVRIRVKK